MKSDISNEIIILTCLVFRVTFFAWQNLLLEFLLEEKYDILLSAEISLLQNTFLDGFGLLHLCHSGVDVEGIAITQGKLLHGNVRGIHTNKTKSCQSPYGLNV